MLLLLFDLGRDRYALDAREVVEVLPLVRIKQIPRPPLGVAGLLNYRGVPVPVIDLTALMLGRPSQACLSTRLIIVEYRADEGRARRLGLIAEHVTDTMRRPDREFVATGLSLDDAPYLGPVATDSRGIVQLVDVARLLPPPVRDQLFQQAADA